ncbi:hypothetical protein FPQ18DRAFT_330378 [Pyronema domesticum]|nr:hypothetical protein FPQ18DRAFT_330378 [Pyronema domesticum]
MTPLEIVLSNLKVVIRKRNYLDQLIQMINVLLKNGSNVNNGDQVGRVKPLRIAVSLRCPQIITILLKSEADINAVSLRGETPLDIARSRLRMTTEGGESWNQWRDIEKMLLYHQAWMN